MHKQSFMGRNTIKPNHPREVNWEGEGEGNWIRSKVCCSIRIFTKPGQVEKDRIGYETFPSIPCGDSQLDGNIEPNAITTFPAISIVFCLLLACLVGRYFRTWCGCCLGLFSIDFLGGGKIDEDWGSWLGTTNEETGWWWFCANTSITIAQPIFLISRAALPLLDFHKIYCRRLQQNEMRRWRRYWRKLWRNCILIAFILTREEGQRKKGGRMDIGWKEVRRRFNKGSNL